MNSQQHPTATAIVGRRLISSAEFRALVGGISEMSRWRREKAGVGPQPVKVGRRNYYLLSEVSAYLDQLASSRTEHGDEANGGGGADAASERIAATDTKCTKGG